MYAGGNNKNIKLCTLEMNRAGLSDYMNILSDIAANLCKGGVGKQHLDDELG